MLTQQPDVTNCSKKEVLLRRLKLCKPREIDLFKRVWTGTTPDVPFPGTQDGEEVTYQEWEESGNKCQGMRKADKSKHGIVRKIIRECIYEETFNNNKKHGLSLEVWNAGG